MSTAPDVSVILCTHNPRADYLGRVLESLRQQSLPVERWELLLVDNKSNTPLHGLHDLSWHPRGRHIREEELGLTAANLRGIREAAADLIVFVHDDNVLAPDYLQVSLDILDRMPWMGAFNGSTVGEYEVPLPAWASMMPIQLAVREIKQAAWGCRPGTQSLPFAPVGAGMVIRKSVAELYARKVGADKVRQALGRKGGVLSSGEDSDMAFCACELGYAVGVFPELSLLHLMPKERLQRAYLLKLGEGMAFSHAVLRYIWDNTLPPDPRSRKECRSTRVFNAYSRLRTRLRGNEYQLFEEELGEAVQQGNLLAHEFVASLRR